MMKRLVLLCVMLVSVASALNAKEPRELFNGKDLAGWDGDPRVWSAEDGAIVGRTKNVPLKNNTFLIWKDGELRDFKLSLEFNLDGGNSGIQYRSKTIDPANWIVGGYQADMDGDNQYTGILYEERGRGILANRGQRLTISREGAKEEEKIGDAAELAKAVHKKDWNEYVVEARGARLKHTINGKLMSETIDRDREHKAASGILALQVHANLPAPMTVKFRKIRLEELEPKTPKAGASKAKKQQ